MPGAGSPTLSGLNGAPEVDGVNVSISHSERLAAALASPDRGYAIGVDVEAIPSDARGEDLLAERILSPAERDGLPSTRLNVSASRKPPTRRSLA